MSSSLHERIASEVRSYLKCVSDIETVRFKTVLKMLEQRLNLTKESLIAEKETIKAIIREEGMKEFESREASAKKQFSPIGRGEFDIAGDGMNSMMNLSLQEDTRRDREAFNTFSKEQRNIIHASNPALPVNELSGIIDANWKALPMKEKQYYMERSEMKDLSLQTSESYGKPKRDMRSKDSSMSRLHGCNTVQIPKKPRSAYIFFCLKHRQRIQDENENLSPVDVSRRLGQEWNALSPEEKEPFKQSEYEDRIRFQNELKNIGMTPEDLRRTSRNSFASASRAKSAYLYFCSLKREEMRSQNPQMSSNEINRALNARWTEMPEEERFLYESNAFDDKERIKREVEKVKMNIKQPFVLPVPKAKRMKRARTPYTFFYKEQMARLREQNGGLGFGEISKKLSDIWKSLPDEEKQPYIEKSRLEQETINPEEDENSGFVQYMSQRSTAIRQSKPSISDSEIREICGREWGMMSHEMKEEYAQEKRMKMSDVSVPMDGNAVMMKQDGELMIMNEGNMDPSHYEPSN
ncbi:hypothetical protein WA577_002589 [Blastocystis sp. JDR]